MRLLATEGVIAMQLSASVLPLDPSLPTLPAAGLTGPAIPGITGRLPAIFADLLPGQPAPAATGGTQKNPATPDSATLEAAAAQLVGWLFTTPVPVQPVDISLSADPTAASVPTAAPAASAAPAANDAEGIATPGESGGSAPAAGFWSAPVNPGQAGPMPFPQTAASTPKSQAESGAQQPLTPQPPQPPQPAQPPLTPPPPLMPLSTLMPLAAAPAPLSKAALPTQAERVPVPSPTAPAGHAIEPATATPAAPTVELAVVASVDSQPSGTTPLRRAAMDERGAVAVSVIQGENIAPAAEKFVPRENSIVSAGDKKILSTTDKQVTGRPGSLGIGIAMPATTMSMTASHPTNSTAALPPAGALGASAERTATSAQVILPETTVASQAQRAVEAVTTAAERASTAGRTSVKIQFSLSGADLSVRVELRGDAVHATFQTDSSELRTALAAEWQTASAGAAGGMRLTEAVFTPATPAGNAGTSLSGEGAPQQRENQSREAAEVFDHTSLRPLASGRRRTAAAVSDSRPWSARSNLNLYTFA